jgi:SAM-dependent methyltransferase
MNLPASIFSELIVLSSVISGYPDGVLVTADMVDRIGTGTTSQFREDSAVYDDRYFNADGKIVTLRRALEYIPGVRLDAIVRILDIGCGSGNATFAMLDMIPGCKIYATDISAEMVSILVRRAETRGVADRVVAFVSDAETLDIPNGAFDLIVGSSMLHHLMHPDRFLDRSFAALNHNGIAIFTEPMKAGHLIVRYLLDEIVLREDLHHDIATDIIKFFVDYSFTIEAMCTLERSRLDYSLLDDKWMFSRSFFEDAALRNEIGYKLFSVNPSENLFCAMIERLVWLGLGKTWQLPNAARAYVSRFDKCLPEDVVDEFAFEACAVFWRPQS